jgi:hypothetical protein
LPSAIHSIACASRRARVSVRFASVIHSMYSRLWLGGNFLKDALAFLFFFNAADKSGGGAVATAGRRGRLRSTLTPYSLSAIAFLT